MIALSSSDAEFPRYFESKSEEHNSHNSLKFSQLKSSLINCDVEFIINLLIEEL